MRIKKEPFQGSFYLGLLVPNGCSVLDINFSILRIGFDKCTTRWNIITHEH